MLEQFAGRINRSSRAIINSRESSAQPTGTLSTMPFTKAVPLFSRPLTVDSVSDFESFSLLREEWDQLNRSATKPSHFRSWEWAFYWYRFFMDANSDWLNILTVRDYTGELVAIFPLHPMEHLRGESWARGFRLLRDFGWRQERLTEEPTTLVAPGYEQKAVEAILQYLSTSKHLDWDAYLIEMQSAQAPCETKKISARFAPHLELFQYREKVGSMLVRLPSTWAEYRKQVSRSMRDNFAYYPRRLTKSQLDWRTRFLTTPDEVRDTTPIIVGLHRDRAKNLYAGNPHENHLPNERHERMLEAYLPALAERGEAFIVVLEIGGVPIAGQIFLRFHNTVTFYFSGFDEEYYPYSPLFIIATEVIKKAIEDGNDTIDFLPGANPAEAPWKIRWGAQQEEPIHELFVQRPRLVSLIRSAKALYTRHREQQAGKRSGECCSSGGSAALPPGD